MNYSTMTVEEKAAALAEVKKRYAALQKEKFSLNMSRGKPCVAQLDIALPMLDLLNAGFKTPKGMMDYRNYGYLDGIPEAKALMAELLEVTPEMVFVGGNSSLNLMYDQISRCYTFGCLGKEPWSKGKAKFLCPVPGYDRHFAITKLFGIEMISVPMDEDGPNMDLVEDLVKDLDVKGMWCVPRFSNPGGVVYSDAVVDRLAAMKTGAADFRIFWDNAYFIHDLYPDAPKLKNIMDACKAAGNPDRVYMFASTSKITFAGAGIAVAVMSENNMAEFKANAGIRTIGYDKLNQYAHVQYLKNAENTKAIMAKQADILRPKFEMVEHCLAEAFGDFDLIKWTNPKGGYFISLDVMPGTAKAVVDLCKKAGLTLTPAGSTHPLMNDDLDMTIRIAPSLPPVEELETACKVLVCCIEYAALEALLK